MVMEMRLLFPVGSTFQIRDGCGSIGVIIGVAILRIGAGVIIKGDMAIWGGCGHEWVWLY